MFSLLVNVKNLSYFPYNFIQVQAFRKMIVRIYFFLFSALWEHRKQVSVKYKYILDQIVYWLTSVSCVIYRQGKLLNMHL